MSVFIIQTDDKDITKAGIYAVVHTICRDFEVTKISDVNELQQDFYSCHTNHTEDMSYGESKFTSTPERVLNWIKNKFNL